MVYHVTDSEQFRLPDGSLLRHTSGHYQVLKVHSHIIKANNEGYRTPLFKDADARDVLERWRDRLANNIVRPLEEVEFEKAGPFYAYPWDEWKDKVYSSFIHEPMDFDLDVWRSDPSVAYGVETLLRLLKQYIPTKLRPLPIGEAYRLSRKGTNLGYPVANSDWTKPTIVQSYLDRADMLIKGKHVKLWPFILFKRVQPGGFATSESDRPAKQRPVWGADHAETFAGIAVLKPILDALMQSQIFADLEGIDSLERSIQETARAYTHKFSLDLGSADATFGPFWVLTGLSILRELIDVPETYLEQVYSYYTSGPLHTPDGVVEGIHGLPSGVALTNLLERFCFSAMAYGAALEQGIDLAMLYQNGDDGLYLSEEELDTKRMAESFAKRGLILNESKSTRGTDYCSYLQRHFYADQGWTAIMSTTRMLGRILFSERGVDVSKVGMSVSQFWILNTLSKLENCKRHPQFAEFVEFVKQGDKFGLDPSLVGGSDVTAAMGWDVREARGFGSETGIWNWESVKLLSKGTQKSAPASAFTRGEPWRDKERIG